MDDNRLLGSIFHKREDCDGSILDWNICKKAMAGCFLTSLITLIDIIVHTVIYQIQFRLKNYLTGTSLRYLISNYWR